MQSYRELKVWQLAMEVAEQVYAVTRNYPQEERYGLTSQVRRASVSIPANIAEGQARGMTKVYLKHLSIARGSLAELETELELARRFGYGNADQTHTIFRNLDQLSRMLSGLQKSLRKKLD